MRVPERDHERGEHPVEDDRDGTVPEENRARDHGGEVEVTEPQPGGCEEPFRLEEKAAPAGEVDADPGHENDDQKLRGQEAADRHREYVITEFNSRGTLLFDYDFTLVDIRIFLDANYNLGLADEYRGLLIRAVHVPANYLNNPKMQQVKQAATISELESIIGKEVKHLELNRKD
jgi:hypothetical protein